MSKLDMTKVTRAFHSVGFKIKKHSPEILIVTGIVGVVTSAVMACKATTKVNEVIEKGKTEINDVHDKAADVEAGIVSIEEYTPEVQRKELTIAYARTGYELVKLYAPAVTVGVLSLTAIISSNHILRKRNVALAAAYASTEKLFKEYRGRVVERFGKELDRELRYNIKSKEIEETTVNEDGSEVTQKRTIQVVEGPIHDEFSRVFDEYNPNWVKDAAKNKYFLLQVERFANEKLQRQGYLFLNDVLEALGFDKISSGQVVGWTYNKGNPDSEECVSFGIWDDVHVNKAKAAFVNEYEKSVIIDFNHEGNILAYV
jgi:hypothetical protein